MTWVLDLDGVLWRGDQSIAGSPHAVARLESHGAAVAYATNNASLDDDGYVAKFFGMGIQVAPRQIVHGGHALASVVAEGARLLNCAGIGVAEACAVRPGVEVVDVTEVTDHSMGALGSFDAVAVGRRPDYDFAWLGVAVRAVLGGASLLAPSGDPLYPQSDGFTIGGGSLARAVGFATGVEPTITGKPSVHLADEVRARVEDAVEVVVGDQPSTDGRLAQQLGVPFVLVRSGVAGMSGRGAAHDDDADVPCAFEFDDLSEAVDAYLDGALALSARQDVGGDA